MAALTNKILALTPATARNGTSFALVRKNSPVHAQLSAAALVFRAVTLINAGKNMSSDQIKHASASIAQKHYYMKVEEVALALERGIEGRYGKLYDVFDYSVICSWLDTYWDERVSEREDEQLNLKSTPVETGLPEEVSNFLTKTFLPKLEEEVEVAHKKEVGYLEYRQQYYAEQARKSAEEVKKKE